jgi:hypothetical protein
MRREDAFDEGRKEKMMDIDRMVNEGLGGGRTTTKAGDGAKQYTGKIDAASPMPDEAPPTQNGKPY